MTRRTPIETIGRNNGPALELDDGTTLEAGEVAVVTTVDPVIDANIEPAGRIELHPQLAHAPDLERMDRHGRPGRAQRGTGAIELPHGTHDHLVNVDGGLEL